MVREGKDEVKDSHFLGEIKFYGDPEIASYDAKVPKFLIWVYILLPIWGILALYVFWNGSFGWFDRGYWHELQIAANTTFPIENQNMLLENQDIRQEKEARIQQIK
jgi:hypothetical protein